MFLISYFGCTKNVKQYSVTNLNVLFYNQLSDLKLFIFVGHISERECKKKLRLIKSYM